VYKSFFKPAIDALGAFILLLLFFPFIVACMLLLFFANKGQVFFTQKRPGLHGKSFHIIKLKTMTDAKDANGMLLPDSERLTWIGAKIRALSLDELLQLVNVLIGDMSLVGPRPLLVDYLPRYSARQAKRHDVRPGITGLAQVNGRNAITWEQKFEYDVEYVEKISLLLDIHILIKTLFKVLQKKDISPNDNATMEEFKG